MDRRYSAITAAFGLASVPIFIGVFQCVFSGTKDAPFFAATHILSKIKWTTAKARRAMHTSRIFRRGFTTVVTTTIRIREGDAELDKFQFYDVDSIFPSDSRSLRS